MGDSGHHVAGCPAGWPTESPPPAPSGEEDDDDEEEEEEPPGGSVGGSGGLAGTVFRLHFLGSVEVDEEGGRKRRKRLKKHMVEEAVTKIKVVGLIWRVCGESDLMCWSGGSTQPLEKGDHCDSWKCND